MSWTSTAYLKSLGALQWLERVVVLRVYVVHACSFNNKSDYKYYSPVDCPRSADVWSWWFRWRVVSWLWWCRPACKPLTKNDLGIHLWLGNTHSKSYQNMCRIEHLLRGGRREQTTSLAHFFPNKIVQKCQKYWTSLLYFKITMENINASN